MSRGEIDLEELVKRYGDVVAVDGIDLHMPGGEFFTMLGPSGCGKTTTLRLIAGFERLDGGAIQLDGVDMSRTPPHKRPRQHGLPVLRAVPAHDRAPRTSRSGCATRSCTQGRGGAAGAARRWRWCGSAGWRTRRPAQLSGGQQQRVALARAIVLEPPVLLLDEPLGALDARLRVDLQVELKRIQEPLGITFIYVTHDQDEALTMSDRVAVMRDGRVEQCGEPRELYEEPATAFVANFLGASNLIPATVVGGRPAASGEFTLRADVRRPHGRRRWR